MKCFFNECVGEGQIPVSNPKNTEKSLMRKDSKWKLTNCYELLILLKGITKEDLHTLDLKLQKWLNFKASVNFNVSARLQPW